MRSTPSENSEIAEIDMQQTRPKTLLVKNAQVLVTMDDDRREIRDGGLFIEDNRIVAVGPTSDLPQDSRRSAGPARAIW